MVRYVILRKFLQELPLWVSFRDPRGSDWLTPRGGHLREVAIPDLATWGAGLLPKDLSAEVPAATELTDEDTGNSSDEETEDWPADDSDRGEYSPEEPLPSQPVTLAVDT